MSDFAETIQEIGRVTVRRLPAELIARRQLAREVAKSADLLRARVPLIDLELGLTYPPIEIIPTSLQPTIAKWGQDSVVFARTTFRTYPQGTYMIVQLCAPTLLVATNDQVDAVLGHEFLHYVRQTLYFCSITDVGEGGIAVARTEDEHPNYMNSLAEYLRIDPQLQASSAHWLSPRLDALVRAFESPDKPHRQRIANRTFERWIAAGYPVESMDPNYRYEGPLMLDDSIAEKARRFGR